MAEQVKEEPTLEDLARIAESPDWCLYGPVFDRQALGSTITELQSQGLACRAVDLGNHWNLYVQRKAQERELPEVAVVNGLGYIVRSASDPNSYRLVSGNTCTCPAGTAKSCRHRRAVAEFCAARDRQYKRPSAPPAISMLVD